MIWYNHIINIGKDAKAIKGEIVKKTHFFMFLTDEVLIYFNQMEVKAKIQQLFPLSAPKPPKEAP